VRFATVCSGIGAPEVAWSHLGWEHAFCAEIDPFASAVLAHRFPDVPNLGDLTKIGAERGPVDLLCGGTPCQSFSVAGRRAGLDDPRGVLAFEFLRLAGRLRAEWVVWENVPGVLSIDGGRAFGAFLGALVELGYGFAYRVLDAQWFGLAQRRARVFVVARVGDWRGPVAVLLEPEGLRGDSAPCREAGEGVAPTLANRARGGGGLGTDAECDGALIAYALGSHAGAAEADAANRSHESGGPVGSGVSEELAHSLRAGRTQAVAHSLRADGFDASEDGTGRGTPLVVAPTVTAANNPSRSPQSAEVTAQVAAILAATLTQGAESQGKGGYAGRRREDDGNLVVGAVTAKWAKGGGPAGDEAYNLTIADPISANEGRTYTHEGKNNFRLHNVVPGSRVRRFTPRECERLQGFPDDWTLVPYRGKPAKDGPRYRAIGNAFPVPVLRWIGERIALYERIESEVRSNA
jgi:DNA (cytosine-5)-methyltransferase 1